MLLRTLAACVLIFVPVLTPSANAEIVLVHTATLTGQITEISALDASGGNDSQAFQNILPFSVGSEISAIVQWRVSATQFPSVGARGFSTDGIAEITLGNTAAIRTLPFASRDDQLGISMANNNAIFPDPGVDSLDFTIRPDFSDPGFISRPFDGLLSDGWTIERSNFNSSVFKLALDGNANLYNPGSENLLNDLTLADFGTLTLDISESDLFNFDALSTWTFDGSSHTASARNIRGEFDSLSWTTSTIEITAVPEPTTGILVVTALGALVVTRRNRRC